MKKLIGLLLLSVSSLCAAGETSFNLYDIDQKLSEIFPHAGAYPPNFTSKEEQDEIGHKLSALIGLLDSAELTYPENKDILYRDGVANAMGHNMDFPGSSQKAIVSFERLLKLDPDNVKANYYYGAFLAGTSTLRKQSVPYLKKAAELGVDDAHYTLGFAYASMGDKKNALREYGAYLKLHPDSAVTQKMMGDLKSGKVKIKEISGK